MYRIISYNEENCKIWDTFITQQSVNGTFLHSRRFYNYHPEGRFQDASFMVYDEKNRLVAICPGCTLNQDGKKVFFSHKGSTFGGPVIAGKYYSAKYVIPLVKEIEEYLKNEGYDEMYMKITPDIFCTKNSGLLEYAYYYHGYEEYKELNTFIDYSSYKDDILSNFSQGKRTHVHSCEREGLITKPVSSDEDVAQYYDILCENLSKYGLKPVHTLDELLEFKNDRLKNEVEFFGTYHNGVMVAGGMLFYFKEAKTAHTQYLSARADTLALSPMTYTYYWIIDEMRKRGYKRLSWGIATEDFGKVLNDGLIANKESYGSTYGNYITYHKLLG